MVLTSLIIFIPLLVPKSVLGINNMTNAASTMLHDNKSEEDSDSVRSGASEKSPSKSELAIDTSTPIPDFIEDFDEIDAYTNHPLVERAFDV